MRSIEKLRKDYSTVNLFFATFAVIPFQVLLMMTILMSASIESLQTTKPDSFLPNSAVSAFAFLVIPVVYCVIASHFFHPKRIVSPLNVQIGTMIAFALTFVYQAITTLSFSTEQTYLNLFIVLFMISSVAGMVGFIQLIVVKWLVGLNFNNIDEASFVLNMPPKDFFSNFGNILHNVWDFNRRKDKPKAETKAIWVLKSKDPYGNSVILSIGSAPDDENKSIIATVAYHSSLYEISKTDTASNLRDSIINDLSKRMEKIDSSLSFSPLLNLENPTSIKARKNALFVASSKTLITKEFFMNIPRYYLYSIILTAFAFAGVTAASFLGYIDSNTYIGSVVLTAIAFIFELGASIREEWNTGDFEDYLPEQNIPKAANS